MENFHTSDGTQKASLIPLALLVGRVSGATGLVSGVVYQILRFVLYLVAALVVLYAYETFLDSSWQILVAVVAALCCVPLHSLVLPALAIFRGSAYSFGVAGSEEYMYVANSLFQDWNHSIFGAVGMITTVAGVAGAHRFARSGDRKGLSVFVGACAVSALLHPFEVFLLLPYLFVSVTLRHGVASGVKAMPFPVAVSVLCMLPYLVPALFTEWVRLASEQNRGHFLMSPTSLLGALGIPSILALGSFLCWPVLVRFSWSRDRVQLTGLGIWLVLSLLLPFAEFLPFPRHLLNGISIVIGMFCALLIARLFRHVTPSKRILGVGAVSFIMMWSLAAHFALRYYAFRDALVVGGESASSGRFPTSCLTEQESTILSWFHAHSHPADTVLAPEPFSWLLPSLPMHSFGGHYVFGYARARVSEWAEAKSIVEGHASVADSEKFLRAHRIRFLITSPVARSVPGACRLELTVADRGVFDCSRFWP